MGNIRARIRKFPSILLYYLVLECKGEMSNKDMDISRLTVFIQQVEEEKKRQAELQDKERQAKRQSLQTRMLVSSKMTNRESNGQI